jgi:excinuclease ABC subunit A
MTGRVAAPFSFARVRKQIADQIEGLDVSDRVRAGRAADRRLVHEDNFLDVRYKGRNIYDVLEMTVREAMGFFADTSRIVSRLQVLDDVGLGYLRLGQSATTLSGGEAQRVKLAAYLSRRAATKTLYIFDEPTTGLHFDDINKLLGAFNRLVERGSTLVVIEHNLDVIKTADWVIDLGPEGGHQGGEIVAAGPPEVVAENPRSHTGRYLAEALG